MDQRRYSDWFRPVEKLAYANIANCAVHLHDVRRGLRAVRAAIELDPDPVTAEDCFVRVMAENHYARLLLEIGQVEHAKEHCELARKFALKAPSARAEYLAESSRAW